MSNQRGSLSLEAAVVIAVFLLLMSLFYSYIYGYRVERLAFQEATIYLLENNHEFISEEDFEEQVGLEFLEVERGYTFRSMKLVEEPFPYEKNGFSFPLEEVVFITDTGRMYHLPGCPTVKKSLRPVMKKEFPDMKPCGVCH